VVSEALAVAEQLAGASRSAVQWTKRVLNLWMRQSAPVFGESLALEMLGFLGPDAKRASPPSGSTANRTSPRPLTGRACGSGVFAPSTQLEPVDPPGYWTVTRVPMGVIGHTTAALAGGISTQPSLWGDP